MNQASNSQSQASADLKANSSEQPVSPVASVSAIAEPISTGPNPAELKSAQHKTKRKKQYLAAIGILLLGIGLFLALKSMKKPPEQKPVVDKTPLVNVMPIVVSEKTLTVNSYGVVEPKYQTQLTAQVSGEIVALDEVFIRGGFVNKGQVLAQIDPSDYQAALLDAESKVASAQAALEKEQAQGKVAEQEWLAIEGAQPTELSLRKPQLAEAQAQLKAANASLLRARRNLERSEIRAPFDAIVDLRLIGLGSFVGIGAKIGNLLSIEVAQVRLPVASKEMAFLLNSGEGAKVQLSINVAEQSYQWQAEIARHEGVIDNTNRMHYLVAEILDPYQLSLKNSQETGNSKQSPLRFGTYVNASISGISLESVATIERQYFVNDRVPVLSENSTLALIEVEILRQEGNQVIVRESSAEHPTRAQLHQQQLVTTALEEPIHGMKLKLNIAK